MESLGQHILAEYFECDAALINDISYIEKVMLESAAEAGATIISSSFHHFSPYGISGVVVIKESHLAIHTWPEYHFASVDLFTCGKTVNPWKAFDYLKIALKANRSSSTEMDRGANLIPDQNINFLGLKKEGEDVINSGTGQIRESWFTEITKNTAISIRHKGEKLFGQKSSYHQVEVYDTFEFGKMLVVNGKIYFTESDHYIYHEMLVHPVMNYIKSSANVLIIGGSDGGTIGELLKYRNINKVLCIENDPWISAASRIHFSELANNLSNPKIEISEVNRNEFIRKCSSDNYDLIIIDTLPENENPGLENEFIKEISRMLKNNGILIFPAGFPDLNIERINFLDKEIKSVFGDASVHRYIAHNASRLKIYLFFLVVKDKLNPIADLREYPLEEKWFSKGLHYYNQEVLKSCFNIQNHMFYRFTENNLCNEDKKLYNS